MQSLCSCALNTQTVASFRTVTLTCRASAARSYKLFSTLTRPRQLTQPTSTKPSGISKITPENELTDSQSLEHPDYARLILSSRVYDVQPETPLEYANVISSRVKVPVYLKREDRTHVFSFKIRGAYNLIAHLSEDEKRRGVIACSAGNHAQGVAYAARHLGVKATIVMPVATPSIKFDNVRRLGAEVILEGHDFDACKLVAARIREERNLTDIPPFDHPLVIAGQGTVALEISRQIPNVNDLRAVFCAIGGGGLVSGMGAYLKRFFPHVKVIGCETYDADAMYQSLKNNKRTDLKEVGIFADGSAVRSVGNETFRLARQYVDEIVRVDTDAICAAIKDVFEETRAIVEPSAALAVACMKKYAIVNNLQNEPRNSLCCVLSGANMNFDRLRFVAERAELGQGKEYTIWTQIPDRSGAFAILQSIISPRPLTEFSYRSSGHKDDSANIVLSFRPKNHDDALKVLSQINTITGFKADDLTEDDFAKTHFRYMMGGRSSIPNERLLQFSFPERPGALDDFLVKLKSSYNISLFHYRNFGSDRGKVLVGLQVPAESAKDFEKFLISLDYPYREQTDSLVYKNLLLR